MAVVVTPICSLCVPPSTLNHGIKTSANTRHNFNNELNFEKLITFQNFKA